MAIRGSYPHPVLDAGSDDVTTIFLMHDVKLQNFTETIDITFALDLSDSHLRALIAEDRAQISAKVTCSGTLYTRVLKLEPLKSNPHSATYHLTVPQDDVNGEVTVRVTINATTDFEGYRPSGQNPEYGDATFKIMAGDVLADAGDFTFIPGKTYDPMNPPLNSCFAFESVDTQRVGIDVDLSGTEQIVVRFPMDTFQRFNAERMRPDLQVSLVVLPALTHVLWEMQAAEGSTDDDFQDRIWYRAIKATISKLGIENNSPIVQAQRILDGNPIDNALQQLDSDMEE